LAVSIENRAQLVYLLTEAAELEHNVLCCYLFAEFSMKDDTSEGLTSEQLSNVRRWRSTMREIASQEMLHLASACNLLTAIGGAPQLRRPNLPTSPRAYPSAFRLGLVPFGLEAIDQFIFLERPESLDPDARAVPDYRRAPLSIDRLSDIFSSERDYRTLGELYRAIEDGLRYLTQKLGEGGLFIGHQASQTTESYFRMPGLIAVRDLESALAALQVIIEQGEGASLEAEDSHYRKFLKMREEYASVLAGDGDFKPGRPVVESPQTIMPSDLGSASGISAIEDPLTISVCNLFDGCYELLVQMLGRLFVHADESEAELKLLADTTVGLMSLAIEPLGSAITRLPAGPTYPGLNAGPGFRLSRGASIPTHKETARFVFHERLSELAAYCRFLESNSAAPPVLARIREALTRLAASLVA